MDVNSLETSFLVIISVDILLMMNIAYINKGLIVRHRKEIVQHYFRDSGIVDIVKWVVIKILVRHP